MKRCAGIFSGIVLLISKLASVDAEPMCNVTIIISSHNMSPGFSTLIQMPYTNETYYRQDGFFTNFSGSWDKCYEKAWNGFWRVSVMGIGVHFELNEDQSHFVVNGSVTKNSVELNAYPVYELPSAELSAKQQEPEPEPTCGVRINITTHALPLSDFAVFVEMPSKTETYDIWFNYGFNKAYRSNWTMCTANNLFGIWTVSINHLPSVSFQLTPDQPYFMVNGSVILSSRASHAEIHAYPVDELKAETIENLPKKESRNDWPVAESQFQNVDNDFYWIDSVAKSLRKQEDKPNKVTLLG